MTYKKNFAFMFDNSRADSSMPTLLIGVSKENLKDALSAIGSYNEFKPERVYDAIMAALEVLEGNADVLVGREGSPVVYTRTKASTEQDEFVVEQAMKVLKSCSPDELTHEKFNSVVYGTHIRMWFD